MRTRYSNEMMDTTLVLRAAIEALLSVRTAKCNVQNATCKMQHATCTHATCTYTPNVQPTSLIRNVPYKVNSVRLEVVMHKFAACNRQQMECKTHATWDAPYDRPHERAHATYSIQNAAEHKVGVAATLLHCRIVVASSSRCLVPLVACLHRDWAHPSHTCTGTKRCCCITPLCCGCSVACRTADCNERRRRACRCGSMRRWRSLWTGPHARSALSAGTQRRTLRVQTGLCALRTWTCRL